MNRLTPKHNKMAKKIIELLQEQRYGKERLQTAAAQYGIPVGDALKLTPNPSF